MRIELSNKDFVTLVNRNVKEGKHFLLRELLPKPEDTFQYYQYFIDDKEYVTKVSIGVKLSFNEKEIW